MDHAVADVTRTIDEHEALRAVATYTVTINAALWWTALAASGVPAAEAAFAVMREGEPLMQAIAKMRPGELRAMYGHLRRGA